MIYQEWLERRVQERRSIASGRSVCFSILTTVYERTDARFFRETSAAILAQDYASFEWIILAHGRIGHELADALDELSKEPRLRILRAPENLGIIAGLRYCLDHAREDYIVPVDGDDLLTPDALRILAHYIEVAGRPAMAYSDEDHLVNGEASVPYFRPDFDPVLATESSYIWHLCAIRRDAAVSQHLYSDKNSEWCHDWDSVMRILRSRMPVVHIPEILYHWRTHDSSLTNRPQPEAGSLLSQKHVLEKHIATCQRPDLYSVEEFPMFRGSFEWWIRRKPLEPAAVTLIVFGDSRVNAARAAGFILRHSHFPFADVFLCGGSLENGDRQWISDLVGPGDQGTDRVRHLTCETPRDVREALLASACRLVVVADGRLSVQGELWPWECQKMFELHHNVSVVAGRVVDESGRVVGGAEIFGYAGSVGCPDAGRDARDPGYFALALKQKCVSAPSSALFMAKKETVLEALTGAEAWQSLGAWIGGLAAARGERVAYSPIFTGVIRTAKQRLRIGFDEWPRFCYQFREFVPDHRCYSASLGTAYSLNRQSPSANNK